MVGNLEVAWGLVGRTCRDVVARREGELLGSWGGKSAVVLALAVRGRDSLLGHRRVALGGALGDGGGGGGRGWRKWQVELGFVVRWGVVWLFGDGPGWVSLKSFPLTNVEHAVVQGLLGEVHQKSLSFTCKKLHV